jgi:copper chaperone
MTQTTQYRVLDFDCPTCASNVEKALEGTEGVEDVEIHFTTGRIEVHHEEDTETDTLKTAIQNQGYTPEAVRG